MAWCLVHWTPRSPFLPFFTQVTTAINPFHILFIFLHSELPYLTPILYTWSNLLPFKLMLQLLCNLFMFLSPFYKNEHPIHTCKQRQLQIDTTHYTLHTTPFFHTHLLRIYNCLENTTTYVQHHTTNSLCTYMYVPCTYVCTMYHKLVKFSY